MHIPTAVAHRPGSWRLLYFDAPNRGEQVRILFALAGTPFDDVRLKYPEGLNPYKKAAMGDASPLLGTDLCPAVTAPDGTHCVETSDIMRFVGARVGWAPPEGSAADAKAMEVVLEMQSVMNGVFYGSLRSAVVQRVFAQEFFGALWLARGLVGGVADPEPMAKLEAALPRLEANIDGPYVAGATPCYADCSVFAILREVLDFDDFRKRRASLLEPHPKLAALLEAMEEKATPYINKRVETHQMGIRRSTDLFAAMNTPLPGFLSRIKRTRE